MRFPRSLVSFIFCFRRLRDPQVQVWAMAGVAVLLVIIGHLRAWSPGSEGKNASGLSPSRLLVAGARVTWTEEFGSVPREGKRPRLTLGEPLAGTAPRPERPGAIRLDPRPAMLEAASKPWVYLDRRLRQELPAAVQSSEAPRIHLAWSGDTRGNAAFVGLQQNVRERPGASGFVIGNGSRSGDGKIEYLPSRTKPGNIVNITLIGQGGDPTPSQLAALGELLNHLEALNGHLLLPDRTAPAGGGPVLATGHL